MQIPSVLKLGERRLGFTLIELLVTIAIIAVLAGISLPMYQRSMLSARRIKGLSNLKQAGAAVMSYAADHENTLPGPCSLAVIPTYSSADSANGKAKDNLSAFLAPYLGMPDASTLTGGSTNYKLVPALVSPGMVAWNSATGLPANRIPHYIQSDVVKGLSTTGGNATIRPFGSNASPAVDPVRLNRLGDFTSTSTGKTLSSVQVWLLSDVDQQVTDSQARASGWFSSLPAKPVYGVNRLRIYADGHAAAAALDEP